MVFSSPTFLFLLLPISLILYQCMPSVRAKNRMLILVSLVFYSFGQLSWVALLVLLALFNYAVGRLMTGRLRKHKKIIAGVAIGLNLGVLILFKYTNFIIELINTVTGATIPLTSLSLPAGISFYTFQGISYVADVARDRTQASRKLETVLLYLCFFPQLVAGPIIQYNDIAGQIAARSTTSAQIARGISRFIVGLSKKLLLANTIGQTSDAIYALSANALDARLAWLGAICYTLQIYFDFSGYSDMAIGLGAMFGFSIKENFAHPYCAGSIQEFWRRWHISLSSWFREYVYIPMGGNRHGKLRTMRNKLTVFFLTGLWHGANWTFMVWGMWHGLLLILENPSSMPRKPLSRALKHGSTLLAVVLGFMVFRAQTLAQAGGMLKAMFTGFSFSAQSTALFSNLLTPTLAVALLAGVFFALPVLDWTKRKVGLRRWARIERYASPAMLLLLIWDILQLASNSFNPFIYFQF